MFSVGFDMAEHFIPWWRFVPFMELNIKKMYQISTNQLQMIFKEKNIVSETHLERRKKKSIKRNLIINDEIALKCKFVI